MRRMQVLATLFATAALFAGQATTAAADTPEEYAAAMRSFAPTVAEWVREVEGVAAAAQAKPEVLRSAELTELAARGFSIAGDLAGTQAPGTYAEAHDALTMAVTALAEATEAAPGGDAIAFAAAVEPHAVVAERSLRRILSYAVRRGRIERPDLPVSGN